MRLLYKTCDSFSTESKSDAMFLRQVTKAVLRPWNQRPWLDVVTVVNRNSSSGTSSSTSELLDKWKKRFETEEVSEVESSLRNILAHVLNVKLAVVKVHSIKDRESA